MRTDEELGQQLRQAVANLLRDDKDHADALCARNGEVVAVVTLPTYAPMVASQRAMKDFIDSAIIEVEATLTRSTPDDAVLSASPAPPQIDMDWSADIGVVSAHKALSSAQGKFTGAYCVRVLRDGVDAPHSADEEAQLAAMLDAERALISAAGEAAAQALWAKVKAGRSPAEVPPNWRTNKEVANAYDAVFRQAFERANNPLTFSAPLNAFGNAVWRSAQSGT